MSDVLPYLSDMSLEPHISYANTIQRWNIQLKMLYFYYDHWLDDNNKIYTWIKFITMLASWSATLTDLITYSWASIYLAGVCTALMIIAGIASTVNQSANIEDTNKQLQTYCKDIEQLLAAILVIYTTPHDDQQLEQFVEKHLDDYLHILRNANNMPYYKFKRYHELYINQMN